MGAVAGSGAYVQELLRPIRGYANIDQQWQSFDRTYHSMQFSATRRFRNGVSFGGNYTLSLSDNGTTGVPLRLQHNADGSFSIREDQAVFNDLMKNQGLQRHIIKANFIWDLPDWETTGSKRIAAAILNDWQLSGIFTGGSGARYDITYQYQNNGQNVNLTGSPDYAARVVINGNTGSGCSGDRFSQFTTAAFSGPLPGSVGLESGRNYMIGCPDKTTDLAISRVFKLGGARTASVPRRDVQRVQRRGLQRAPDAAAAGQPDQPDDPQPAVPGGWHRRSQPVEDDRRRVWRGDRRAAAAHDPGAAAVFVLRSAVSGRRSAVGGRFGDIFLTADLPTADRRLEVP